MKTIPNLFARHPIPIPFTLVRIVDMRKASVITVSAFSEKAILEARRKERK
jgi:hypothetical protein